MNVRVVPGTVAVEPASLTQVMQAAGGETVVILDDAGNVARDLRALDPTLRVRYSIRGRHYVIYQHIEQPDGKLVEHFVTTAAELDPRIVRRVEALVHPSYDAGAALERGVHERRQQQQAAFRDRIVGHADRLAHAIRRDLGIQDRIAVP